MSRLPEAIIEEIQTIYRSHSVPWVTCYSGRRDSTVCLQLIWKAVASLPAEQRTNDIHIFISDTLIDNPVIAAWKINTLRAMEHEAQRQGVPIHTHRLNPEIENRFWVNMIGKGYPAPSKNFRWCTDRLKIKSSSKFINKLSISHGGAILAMGARYGEQRFGGLATNTVILGSRELPIIQPEIGLKAYLPIETWLSDDVHRYIQTSPSPWNAKRQELFDFDIASDSASRSSRSCGDSYASCYVCTKESEDPFIAAMIQNNGNNSWMQPLLDFRAKFLASHSQDKFIPPLNNDHIVFLEDLRKASSQIYSKEYRAQILEELLRTQKAVCAAKPRYYENLELISLEELDAIRLVWMEERSNIEDLVPQIYQRVFDEPYPENC